MHRGLPIALTAALLAGCGGPARRVATRDMDALRTAPLYSFSESELDTYLQWLAGQPMSTTERITLLARKNIGQPYRVFLLGEYPFELYDPDPMYCLSASDCVTFVEQTYAMALSHDWPSFFRTLQRIRYRAGKVGILTRNHFTEADWNVNNAWLFEDITASLPGGRVEAMRVRVDRSAFFARYGLERDDPIEVFNDVYMPRDQVPQVLGSLRDGDIVQIVRGRRESPYVSHVGLVMHGPGKYVTILHSGRPSVREERLTDYLEGHAEVLGLKFLRIRETPQAN